jgi:DinB superfamily
MRIITKLESTRERTLPYFELSDEKLERKYAPGKWSVRVILHHITDTETVLYDRVRRVLSEPGQVQWAFNQDAWVKGLNYSELPLELSRNMYAAVRACVIHQARLHYEIDGGREFVHSESGIRTLKSEFDRIANHNAHHLLQIEQALQGSIS